MSSLLSLRRNGDTTMRLRPRRGILHEFFDLLELFLIELAALLRHAQHVPPGGERVQRDTEVAEDFFAVGKDVVEEDNENVVDRRAGSAQCFAEIDLAAAIAGHVLDQEHAVAILDMTLDLGIAAKALRLLA